VLVEKQLTAEDQVSLPEDKSAAATAAWIAAVLRGEIPVPASIAEQVTQCATVARTLNR
jgi:hypothetical protein